MLVLGGCWDYSKLDLCSYGPNCNDAFGTHPGWTEIKAVGDVVPVDQSGLDPASGAITLAWKPFVSATGEVTAYRVFRATQPGQQDYSSAFAELGTDARQLVDTTLTAGVTYYYTLAAVVDGRQVRLAEDPYSEVKVLAPPPNMALVHRWMANQEMCELMHAATEPEHDYRCRYPGPGSVDGYLDNKSFLIDLFERGCNYTPAPGCDDAVNGCLSLAGFPPGSAVGRIGDVWYSRTSGYCAVKTASGAWVAMYTDTDAGSRARATSNRPGLPPLVQVDQTRAQATCRSATVTGLGAMTLPSHRQQIIAAAWDAQLLDIDIAAIEVGTGLSTSHYCNSKVPSGVTYVDAIIPTDPESLPGTEGSMIHSVRTGGTSTTRCVSRYGVRDLVGNVWEWSSDQLASCDAGSHICLGTASTLDPDNTDWSTLTFDGTMGPGGKAGAADAFPFAMPTNDATSFLVPLGVPIVSTAEPSVGATPIGTAPGQFDPQRFHGDRFQILTDGMNGVPSGPARGAHFGGSYLDGTAAGRYEVVLSPTPQRVGASVGMRCVLAVD